jgi:hypothetical protein
MFRAWPCEITTIQERDAAVERLREFIRLNYATASELARQMGFREETIYSWLSGEKQTGEAGTHYRVS